VTCESVGRAISLPCGFATAEAAPITATAFLCPDSRDTAQLAPGLYDVSAQLDAADGTRLAIASDQTGVSVVSGRSHSWRPLADDRRIAKATLMLSIATGATTNCRPVSAGGAGITGNTIDLEFAAEAARP